MRRGHHRPAAELGSWILNASTSIGAIGALLGTCYALLTLSLRPGSYTAFLIASTVLIVIFSVSGHWGALRSLKTLRKLPASGSVSKPQLLAAIREVARLPDLQFGISVINWVVGAIGLGLAMRFLSPERSWMVAGRVVFLGVMFGTLTTAFGYFVIILRGRSAVRALAAMGLEPRDVVAAVPTRRFRIRARLVAFTAVAVIVPSVLTADVFASLSRLRLERVRAAATLAERRLIASQPDFALAAKIIGLCGMVLALAMATAYAGGTALSEPMREIADYAGEVARGELHRAQLIAAEDELWEVGSAFSTMQAQLVEVLSRIRSATLSIGTATEQILATSARYEAGANSQATALHQTFATTEELARNAGQIAENAGSVASMAQRTLKATEEGGKSAEAFALSIGRMREDNQSIAGSVERLNNRVAQIGKIVEVIHQVASRSDLLALSAELEGIKAGQLGRGFSLVAAEMRRLAESVLESTREIEELIEEIREATAAAVDATSLGVSAAEESTELADAVTASLFTIAQNAKEAFEAVQAISQATQQQGEGTDLLARAMGEILQVTQESTAVTREVGAAHQGLAGVAHELKGVVDRFRVRGGA